MLPSGVGIGPRGHLAQSQSIATVFGLDVSPAHGTSSPKLIWPKGDLAQIKQMIMSEGSMGGVYCLRGRVSLEAISV